MTDSLSYEIQTFDENPFDLNNPQVSQSVSESQTTAIKFYAQETLLSWSFRKDYKIPQYWRIFEHFWRLWGLNILWLGYKNIF